MSNKGYCKAYRTAWTHDMFSDLLEAAIWNYLYQNAFYEDGERIFNRHTFHLKRGQIVTTPRFIAKGFRTTEGVVRRFFDVLNKQQTIRKQTTTKGTIITICNYEKFQSSEKTNRDQTATKPRPNRANNKERINKRKKEEVYIGDFENFWNQYGKIGNKQTALKSYNKFIKTGVCHEEIINGLGKYQAQCRANNTNPKYIKHASTWLNARGWEDEYPIYEPPAPRNDLKESLRAYANEPQQFDPWEIQGSEGVSN